MERKEEDTKHRIVVGRDRKEYRIEVYKDYYLVTQLTGYESWLRRPPPPPHGIKV
jgi:hypothetical protein